MTLKNVLLINAISSGMTGILLAAMPGFFANLFAVNNNTPFSEVGIFLILFSMFVLMAAVKESKRRSWTKLIIGLDVSWVVASIISVLILFSLISALGSAIILAVAAWVGLMAFLQNKTLRTI